MKQTTYARYRSIVVRQQADRCAIFQYTKMTHRMVAYLTLVYPNTRRAHSIRHAVHLPRYAHGGMGSALYLLVRHGAVERIGHDAYRLAAALVQAPPETGDGGTKGMPLGACRGAPRVALSLQVGEER